MLQEIFSFGEKLIFWDFEVRVFLFLNCYCLFKMEEKYRLIFKKYWIDIMKDLEVKKVLNRLIVFEDDDRDEIKVEKMCVEQVDILFDMLFRKGLNVFKDFFFVLFEINGQKYFVEFLIKDLGIEILSILKGENILLYFWLNFYSFFWKIYKQKYMYMMVIF